MTIHIITLGHNAGSSHCTCSKYHTTVGAGVAQSIQCLTTDWVTGVQSLAEAKDFFSSLCVQTSSEDHPASYTMVTGVLSLGVKCSRGMMLTTHTHPVLSYTSAPPLSLTWRVSDSFTFTMLQCTIFAINTICTGECHTPANT
jgi:hypothetical protein